LKFLGSQLEPVKWNELAGWAADDHLAAFAAYQASCRAAHKLRRADHAEISGACGTSAAMPWICGHRIRIPRAPSSNGTFNPFASRA
jgi:hypothetical protein